MRQSIKNISIIAIVVLAIFSFGCDDDDAILPEVTAGFTHNINQNLGVVEFINTSENADSYSWDFGDNTTSTEINPSKIYQPGTYTVVLEVKNFAGVSDKFEDTFTIFDRASLPINFDSETTIYEPTTFNGASFGIVENPDPSGTNATTSNVGAVTNAGANFEGLFFDLQTAVNLSMDMTIIMDIWSDKPLPVLLKLEEGTGPAVEKAVGHGGSGWEELIFTFSSSNQFSRLTLFMDGPGTTNGTFYIDNIMQSVTVDTEAPILTLNGDAEVTLSVGDMYTELGATAMDNNDGDISANVVIGGDVVDTSTAGNYTVTYDVSDAAGNAAVQVTRTVIVNPCSDMGRLEMPIDFECSEIDYVGKIVGNVSFEVIDNPEMSGINSGETKVGRIVNIGANWENAFFNLDDPIDFSAAQGVRMKLFSTQALPILLKFEDGTSAPVENSQNHTGSGWEELTFSFTSSDSYNDMVIFVDGPGTAAGTFYVDDIEQVEVIACSDMGKLEMPVDFECGEIDYAGKIVGNVSFEVIDNPEMSGINSGQTKVGRIVNVGANWENAFFNLDVPIDFSVDQGVRMKLFSTQALPILLKFEDGTSAPVENNQNHTGSGWEELTFSFTSSDSYNDMVIFVDGPGTAAGTFYVDDIEQVPVSGGGGCAGDPVAATSLPVDFESCESFISAFSSTGDGGVVLSLDANPNPSGINTSPNVLKVVRANGIGRWGGFQNSFPAGTIDITTKTFKIKVYSSVDDITYRFELALDPQTDPVTGNPPPVFRQVVGGANTWTEIEFTFTGLPATPSTYNMLVVKPDNPEGSDGETTTEERIFYFDDLRLD